MSINDVDTPTNDKETPDEVKKTVVIVEKAPLHVQPAVSNIVKTTFRAAVGGGIA